MWIAIVEDKHHAVLKSIVHSQAASRVSVCFGTLACLLAGSVCLAGHHNFVHDFRVRFVLPVPYVKEFWDRVVIDTLIGGEVHSDSALERMCEGAKSERCCQLGGYRSCKILGC